MGDGMRTDPKIDDNGMRTGPKIDDNGMRTGPKIDDDGKDIKAAQTPTTKQSQDEKDEILGSLSKTQKLVPSRSVAGKGPNVDNKKGTNNKLKKKNAQKKKNMQKKKMQRKKN